MRKNIFILCSLMLVCGTALADNPKREMRATWLTTVVNIDWPSASEKDTLKQKKELTRMLDSIASMRMNTVLFHIRPAADALYKSHYEPWSSYLNHGRGVDPGYDPLQFCIEECHKRGLTCHGWINPYRYNNRATHGDWTGDNDTTVLNYKYSHPDWLLWYSAGDIVLDPARPEVIQRIKEVVGDIINNYDVDGILMDDYFYPYGGTKNEDAASVQAYCPADKAVGDWRRENVNRMVKACYDTIQAVKPWVTFGISPFGIWTTSSTVAKQRGYTLPYGITGGNMYAEIYCDPMAWLEEGTVDYISPQLYWRTGGSQDYKTLSKWWAQQCNMFGKHFYSSMAVYRYHDGNTGFTIEEMQTETQLNRNAVTDNAPGAVFYNTKAWVYDKAFRKAFQANEFKHIAMPPAINWKPAAEREMVTNLQANGQVISWEHADEDVHFAIYAVPNSFRNRANIFSKEDALLAITYDKTYTLPANITTGAYKIGVSVLDKYNNEFSLRILNEAEETAVATTIKTPARGSQYKLPFTIEWASVKKADSYIVQIARDSLCQDIVMTQETTLTSFSTADRLNIARLPLGEYWCRVKTRKANCNDIWTEAVPFRIDVTNDDAVVAAAQPKARCYMAHGQVRIQRNADLYTILGQKIN